LRNKGLKPKGYLSGLGMRSDSTGLWLAGRLSRVHLRVLFDMCRDLNCTPNDLLVVGAGDLEGLGEGHALRKLAEREAGPTVPEMLKGLSPEELDALVRGLRGEG
jgi:DNA-binding Xre family transcriptional regulator